MFKTKEQKETVADQRLVQTQSKKDERTVAATEKVFAFLTDLYKEIKNGYRSISSRQWLRKTGLPTDIMPALVNLKIVNKTGVKKSTRYYWKGEHPSIEMADKVRQVASELASTRSTRSRAKKETSTQIVNRNLVPIIKEIKTTNKRSVTTKPSKTGSSERVLNFLNWLYKKTNTRPVLKSKLSISDKLRNRFHVNSNLNTIVKRLGIITEVITSKGLTYKWNADGAPTPRLVETVMNSARKYQYNTVEKNDKVKVEPQEKVLSTNTKDQLEKMVVSRMTISASFRPEEEQTKVEIAKLFSELGEYESALKILKGIVEASLEENKNSITFVHSGK